MEETRSVKIYWREKQKNGWVQYGYKRQKYYNRNGWGVSAIENMVRRKEI